MTQERAPDNKSGEVTVSMLSEQPNHQLTLTGIRGLAAFWVYIFHVWFLSGKPEFKFNLAGYSVDLTPPISIGFAGVALFFVLSGFLLSIPFAEWGAGYRNRPSTGKYMLRRVVRVLPAYYVQLTILILIAAMTSGTVGIADPLGLLQHLAMLFVPPPIGTVAINGVWWTLPVEFSFYLALPLLSPLLQFRRFGWLLLASVVTMWLWRHAMVVRLADAPVSARVIASWQLPGSFDMFGFGMLAAVIYVNLPRLPAWFNQSIKHTGVSVVAIVTLIAATYWLASDRHHFWADYPIFYLWTPLVSLATVALVLSGTAGNRLTNQLLGNRLITFMGLISYSFYLWHLPVINWMSNSAWLSNLAGDGFWGRLAVSFTLSLAISFASYMLIERPCMKRWRG